MATQEEQEKIRGNTWETDIMPVIEFIKVIRGREKPWEGWQWSMNPKCKYFSITFDTRDGAFILKDRDNNRIGLSDLLYQYEKGGA